MDTHEIDISDYVEPVDFKSSFTSSPPVVPPWEKKKSWGFWSPLAREYHNIIDNPRRLPTILQPLVSKERAFTFGAERPSYLNFELHATDEYNVHRRFYINLCQENFVAGAVGALLVGVGTNHFKLSQRSVHSFLAQKLILGKPVAAVTRMALTGSILTATFCGKIIIRALTGGILYDGMKRSREERYMSTTKKLQNAGLAGGIIGLFFGLRGGLPKAWAAGFLTGAGALASEFVNIPIIFSTNKDQE